MSALLKSAKVINFKSPPETNAFDLARAIERKSAERALNILADLFANGERSERILGPCVISLSVPGFFVLEESRKKIRLLLETDNN